MNPALHRVADDLGVDGDAWLADDVAEILAGLALRLAAEARMDEIAERNEA